MSSDKITAGCANCRFCLRTTMELQMVMLCRRVPPTPMAMAIGPRQAGIKFMQPIVDASVFCHMYHPDEVTQDRSHQGGIPIVIPGGSGSLPMVAANNPAAN